MRRTLPIAILALALMVTAAPAGASGPGSSEGGALGPGPIATRSPGRATDVRFFGSGWGHGLGMSQWGAYGLALKGWTYRRILTRFYSGTTVGKTASPVRSIRIGLTYDRRLVHLTAKVKPVRLTVGKLVHGTHVGTIPIGKTWTVKATKTGYSVRDADGAQVGGRTWGGSSFDLFVTYASNGGRITVPEADAISGKGFTYARGHLEFNLYGCGAGGCRERVILPIGFEDYLLGIGEVMASWPAEALKAQVVASRTYATYAVKHYGIRAYCNCHLEDGANDQTYVGFDKEGGSDGIRWVKAVRSTKGRVILYHGAAIQAFFAASDGGHSDSVEDVWHGGDPAFAIPYLRGVCDPGEFTPVNPWKTWSRSYSSATLTSQLQPYTGPIGTVQGFPTVSRGEGGRIIRAKVKGTGGTALMSGSDLRSALALPDDRVWINANKNIVGAIRPKYDALNCAPGLPTSPVTTVPGGSRQKFKLGGIFRNNGRDLTVWLKGPIYDEYLAVGGATGKLGLPTSKIVPAVPRRAAATGRRGTFDRGRIFWKPGLGAHALWGKLVKFYVSHGGPSGSLGFPTSRMHASGGAVSATFEHGTIACPSSKKCTIG